MSARQPKVTDRQRIHVHVARKDLRTISAAAKKLGLSRSHYIVTAAHAAAQAEMTKGK